MSIADMYFKDEVYEIKRQAEKKIRSISTISASSLIAFLLVAVMFAFVLDIQAIALFRNSSLSASSFIDMIYTLIVVGGTFAVFKGFFVDFKSIKTSSAKSWNQ